MKLLILLFTTQVCFANGHTLKSLYQSALENTSHVKDKILSHQIAEEQKDQTTAGVLPTLSLNSDHTWRDELPRAGAFGEDYQKTDYANLTQPLFQGGSEYYALGVSKLLPQIAEQEKIQSEIELYQNVAEAYYNVIKIQNVKKILSEQNETLTNRVSTLGKRAKIGRNKSTDVLAARSQLARVTADLAQLESEYIRSLLRLKNITGIESVGNLKDDQSIESLNVPTEWEQNLSQTPVMKINDMRLEAADKEISVATGSFLPSVDLDANYYFDRAGILQGSEWDVGINISWELFSGGEDASERRIKILQKKRVEAKIVDLKRNIKNDFRSLVKEFTANKDVLKKMKLAVDLSKKNYKEHTKEVDRGLVSQLDVLRVLEDYLQIQRSYDEQLFQTKMAWIRLRSLAGIRP